MRLHVVDIGFGRQKIFAFALIRHFEDQRVRVDFGDAGEEPFADFKSRAAEHDMLFHPRKRQCNLPHVIEYHSSSSKINVIYDLDPVPVSPVRRQWRAFIDTFTYGLIY